MNEAISDKLARLLDSQYRAGMKAGWNAAQADDPNAAWARLCASQSYRGTRGEPAKIISDADETAVK